MQIWLQSSHSQQMLSAFPGRCQRLVTFINTQAPNGASIFSLYVFFPSNFDVGKKTRVICLLMSGLFSKNDFRFYPLYCQRQDFILFMIVYYLILSVCHIYFIHSHINGHVGYLAYLLWIRLQWTWNVGISSLYSNTSLPYSWTSMWPPSWKIIPS